MILAGEKGVALLTVIIIIFISLVLSTAILNLMSNQTRIVEHDISRVKSKYANEATMVRTLEHLRRNQGIAAQHPVSGRYDLDTSTWLVNVSNRYISSGYLSGLTELNLTVDYSPSF